MGSDLVIGAPIQQLLKSMERLPFAPVDAHLLTEIPGGEINPGPIDFSRNFEGVQGKAIRNL